jgi:hypothetical protein
MKTNDLRHLQDIKAPETLKQRTLTSARELRETGTLPQSRPCRPRFGMAKRILATACAFGLILGGGVTVWRGHGNPANSAAGNGVSAAGSMANSFGFVAYAADTGKTVAPKNNKIIFGSGSGADTLDKGFFSGCLFQVTGDDIKSVSASIDKGKLYRQTQITGLTDADMPGFYEETDPRIQGADYVALGSSAYANMDDNNDDPTIYTATLAYVLENGFTEGYNPDLNFGFWAPPQTEEELTAESDDLQKDWHRRVDFFRDAKLTVTVTFTDGTSQTQTLTLRTGKLEVVYSENDLLGPQPTGRVLDDSDTETPYIYGVYAEIEQA